MVVSSTVRRQFYGAVMSARPHYGSCAQLYPWHCGALPWPLGQGTIQHAHKGHYSNSLELSQGRFPTPTRRKESSFSSARCGSTYQNAFGGPFGSLRRWRTSPGAFLTMGTCGGAVRIFLRSSSRWRRLHRPYGPRTQHRDFKNVHDGRCGVSGVVGAGGSGHERP